MDNNELFAEVEQTLNEATKEIEASNDTIWENNFRQVEQILYRDRGMEEDTDIYLLESVAESAVAVMDFENNLKDDTEIIRSSRMTPDDIANRAFGIAHAAKGDLYELLGDRFASLLIADRDSVQGIMLRMAVFMSATATDEGVKPSEATDKQDAIMVVLVIEGKMYSAVRNINDPETPSYQTIDLMEYEGGQRLVDALIEFFVFPKYLKQENPEVFKALLTDHKNNHDKEMNDPENK